MSTEHIFGDVSLQMHDNPILTNLFKFIINYHDI